MLSSELNNFFYLVNVLGIFGNFQMKPHWLFLLQLPYIFILFSKFSMTLPTNKYWLTVKLTWRVRSSSNEHTLIPLLSVHKTRRLCRSSVAQLVSRPPRIRSNFGSEGARIESRLGQHWATMMNLIQSVRWSTGTRGLLYQKYSLNLAEGTHLSSIISSLKIKKRRTGAQGRTG